MEQVFNEHGYPLDMSKIEFLSDSGSECIVYKYFNSVIKIYKKDYKFSHLSLDELNTLKIISTQRILLPKGTLWNINHELIGYEMPFIEGGIGIEYSSVSSFFEELKILKQDLDLLCSKFIILRDINLSNTIYNGQIYLIDSGNYLINELEKIIFHLNITGSLLSENQKEIILEGDYNKVKILIDSLTLEEKQKLLMKWNYNKINELIDMLLFSKKSYIDAFQYRQIIQFFMKIKEERNLLYNLDVLKMFFNQNLSIEEATMEFLNEYIKENPKERKLFFSLYNK